MYSINIFQLITIGFFFALNIYVEATNDEPISITNKAEELISIRIKYSRQMREYSDAKVQEVNQLLGTSSQKSEFINYIHGMEYWWVIDIERRQDLYISKLPNLLNEPKIDEAFEKMKQEFAEQLGTATKFWLNEIDMKLEPVRKNPQSLKPLIKEQTTTTTQLPPLKLLSPEEKKLYNEQMTNLTNIGSLLKEIIRTTLDKIEPKLPEKNDPTYMSNKIKFDRIAETFRRNMNQLIDTTRKSATDKVEADWRTQGKNGPTKEEYNTYYNDLTNFATNLAKNLNKNISIEFKPYVE